ncbi:hypothetical protein DMH15_16130 [Streptomyces sp. WAC 06725]|uniref:hypothetical protein n=1 Tax=Streptomyces sp. WAC 06725 TaxID=2203209 RepID=UPI000F735B3B|nr:hypothetical protein [Streptomyces sp. WAC 06725]RSO40146.1 hypothetical protein DMH15_16130 [Streptomyces sp. WAC 06725]
MTTLFDAAPATTTAAGPRPGSRLYRVAGLDISLTGTGIASAGGTVRIPTKGRRKDSIVDRHARLRYITTRVLDEVGTVDLACVEGPSHASMGQAGHHDLSGLWWRIVGALVEREIPVAVIPPMSRAKYATGKGNSRKAVVLDAAQRRYGAILPSDDEADALILRAMGLHHLGQPLAEVPDGHRAALAGCQWPDLPEVAR